MAKENKNRADNSWATVMMPRINKSNYANYTHTYTASTTGTAPGITGPPGPSGIADPSGPVVPYIEDFSSSRLPFDGQVGANVQGKLYRYSQVTNTWVEIIDAPDSEIAEEDQRAYPDDPAVVRTTLFKMKLALVNMQDGVDNSTASSYNDAEWHVKEAIEALNKILG